MRAPEARRLSRVSSLFLAVVAAGALFAGIASDAGAAPTIRFRASGLDRFKFHGRVRLDPPFLGGPVDPATSGFRFDLSNQYGLVYGASLYPGDFEPLRNLYYRFRDPEARYGNGVREGVYQILTRFREYSDGWYYTVRIMAFADLSAATEPRMTVLFSELNGTASITAEWERTQFGWRLPLGRFGP